MKSEDQILAPSYNCGSEISPLLDSSASVNLYRVKKTGDIDLADIKRRLTRKTKVVYVTHYFGFPQPLEELKSFCDENGLYLIEDCALSLFSCNDNVKLGTNGDISVYSFPKSLPVPDGGAMVINNPELKVNGWQHKQPSAVKICRNLVPFVKRNLLRASSESLVYPVLWNALKKKHKTSNLLISEFPDMPSSYYYYKKLDNKGMSGMTKYVLAHFDISDIITKRRRNYKQYLSLLSDIKGIKVLYRKLPQNVCPLYFPVIVNNRHEICVKLNDLSIDAIAWWAGFHRDLPWNEYPDAHFLKSNLLALPVHHQLSDNHIEFISEKLINCISKIQN